MSCPNDTDGDGDCGKRGCPHCGTDPQELLHSLRGPISIQTQTFPLAAPGQHFVSLTELEVLLADMEQRVTTDLPDRPDLALGVVLIHDLISRTRKGLRGG